MTNSFKKFLVGLVSIFLAMGCVYLFTTVYLSYIGPGNTFGGELLIINPFIFLISIYFIYSFLKQALITLPDSNTPAQKEYPPKLDQKGKLALMFWLVIIISNIVGPYRIGSSLVFAGFVCLIAGFILNKLLRINLLKQVLFWLGLVQFVYLVLFRLYILMI